jgi:acetyl esterase/lipase
MFPRLSIFVAVLLGIPLASAHAQRYSTGITADYELIPNVTYLEAGAWQAKLDLYVRADTREPIPTLLFFHGGADDRGNKETELFNFLRYLEHGWNVVNVEHRLPGVTLAPAAMQNGICALRWVLRHANLYGFDVNKLVISGQSAGGWAALAVTMAGPALRADAPCAGDDEIKVAAVVNWYGVSDPVDSLNRKSPGVVASFRGLPSPAEVAKTVSPLHLVTASMPPIISIHGDADGSVPHAQSVQLHAALKAAGVTEKLVTIPRGGHGAFPRAENQRAYAAVEQFLGDLGIRPIAVKSETLPAPAPVSIDSKALSRYVGRSRGRSGDVLTFTNRDGRLFVELASAQKPLELSASAEREFFVGNNRISFVVDAEGRVYGVIVRNSNGRYSRSERVQ